MGDTFKVILGAALIVGGIALTIATMGSAWQVGVMMAYAGLSFIQVGVYGLNQGLNEVRSNMMSPQAGLPVVYGENVRVGIKYAFAEQYGDEDFYIVAAFALSSESGNGITDVSTVYFNDELAIQNPTLDTTSLTTFGVEPNWQGVLSYSIYTGSTTQSAHPVLTSTFSGAFDSTSTGHGIAYIILKLHYDEDKWTGGIPRVEIKLDGTEVYNLNTSTWEYSREPAWILYDYLTNRGYGVGIPASEIDTQSFIDAASYNDDLVDSYDGGPQQARHTTDGFCLTTDDHAKNIDMILSSMRGVLVYEGGRYRLVLRRPLTPVTFELTDDHIVSDVEFVRLGRVPNRIIADFVDGDRAGRQLSVSWPTPDDTNNYLIADNDFVMEQQIELPFTNNYYRAQQIAMTLLKEMRQDTTVMFDTTEDALQLQVGDVVKLSHETTGWTQKEFWVASMGITPINTVKLVLREYDSTAYNYDLQDIRPTVPTTNLPDLSSIAAPTSLILTSNDTTLFTNNEGTVLQHIKADWTHSTDAFLRYENVSYKKATDSDWIFAGSVSAGDTATLTFGPVDVGDLYDVRVIAENTIGVKSNPLSGQVTPSAKATGPGDVTGLYAYNLRGLWFFRWTQPSDVDVVGNIIRYGGTSWATATTIESIASGRSANAPIPRFKVSERDLPIGRVVVRVKAVDGSGGQSTNDATVTITNRPTTDNRDEVRRGQDRRGRYGDADAVAISVASWDGVDLLIDSESLTIGSGLLYVNSEIPLSDLEPVEGASQKNRTVTAVQLEHGELWSAPAGHTIYRVRYISGGLVVQGGSVWDTDPASLPGTTAAPASYESAISVEVDGEDLTLSALLRQSQSGVNLVGRSAAFAAPSTLTEFNPTSGLATPASAYVPAYDDTYSVVYYFDLTSNKSGSYTVTFKLWFRLNGTGTPQLLDTNIHSGTLPELEGGGTLTGLRAGLAGGDDTFYVTAEVSAPGIWVLSAPLGNLEWTKNEGSAPLYASMTPYRELVNLEVETIGP